MPENPIIRAAAVQLSPVLGSADGTVEKICRSIAKAAEEGARIVVFPETVVPYYPYFSFVYPPVLQGPEHLLLYNRAVVVPGPVTEAIAASARQHAIVVLVGV